MVKAPRVKSRRAEEGYLLITVFLVIALLMSGSVLLAASLQYRMWTLQRDVDSVQLAALTDAGIALALDQLARRPFDEFTLQESLGEGEVVATSLLGEEVMVREVVVTATHGRTGRVVRVVVQISDLVPPRVVAWQREPFHPEDVVR